MSATVVSVRGRGTAARPPLATARNRALRPHGPALERICSGVEFPMRPPASTRRKNDAPTTFPAVLGLGPCHPTLGHPSPHRFSDGRMSARSESAASATPRPNRRTAWPVGEQSKLLRSLRDGLGLDSVDDLQYKALTEFRAECLTRGLVESYDSIQQFREKFARQLSQKVIDPRSEAKWEGALRRLRELELIEPLGFKGQVFRVTDKGYESADRLRSGIGA